MAPDLERHKLQLEGTAGQQQDGQDTAATPWTEGTFGDVRAEVRRAFAKCAIRDAGSTLIQSSNVLRSESAAPLGHRSDAGAARWGPGLRGEGAASGPDNGPSHTHCPPRETAAPSHLGRGTPLQMRWTDGPQESPGQTMTLGGPGRIPGSPETGSRRPP